MLFPEVTEDHHCYGFHKRYLDVFLCDRNMIRRIFLTNIPLSSEILGNLWEFSENVRERLSGFCRTIGEPLKIFGKCSKSSENRQKKSSLVFSSY